MTTMISGKEGTFSQAIRALGGQGILSAQDLLEFAEAERVLWVMFQDGKPHGYEEMERLTGQRECLRRVRSLRAKIESKGLTIRRIRKEGRTFEYQLTKAQGELL